jgi:beta-lactamase regulating signal transducer with metallopeptidase domain
MIGVLTNHLWQSTLFAVVAGLLAATLRKNRAQVRYWLWLTASLKFFVPFALLMSLGNHVPKTIAAPAAVSFAMEQITQPFSEIAPLTLPTPSRRDWKPAAIFAVWVCGFLCVALTRFRGWLRIRSAVRASVAIKIPATVEIRSSPGLLEPGVVGVLRPILLLPAGIAERLTPPQLEAVLAHELCHVRRRDNLFASMHMIVEAVFWFHPLIWWIGARLVEERERACDEAVLSLGSEPLVYAEGILKVCKLYVESPLACVSGVTGSDIKKRIEAIMTNRTVFRLNFGKKLALAVAGTAALGLPIIVGIMHAPRLQAQSGGAQSAPAQSGQTQPPQTVERAIAQAAPPPGGRGATPQAAPAGPARLEVEAALAALVKFGSPFSAATRIYKRYGAPDQIDDRGSDAQNPLQIWRYNYLEDFGGNAEFEFAPGKAMHINYPPPVTYDGVPGVPAGWLQTLPAEFFHGSDPAAASAVPGLPSGKNASMQVFPARQYRVLSMPMDALSPAVDIMAQVRTNSGQALQDAGVKTDVTSGVRDFIKWSAPETPTYTASFTLDPGSYLCIVVVREQATGRMYGETINFEVSK